jgi:beta-glucosidase
MASYNAINGAPDAINKYLLTDILPGQWKFDGFVTDDLGGVNLLVAAHHITEDPVEATAAAIKAGCDSDDAQYETNIPLAVKRGLLQTADVDRALARVLRVGFRLGVKIFIYLYLYKKIRKNQSLCRQVSEALPGKPK